MVVLGCELRRRTTRKTRLANPSLKLCLSVGGHVGTRDAGQKLNRIR
jgi:hypothetical protein